MGYWQASIILFRHLFDRSNLLLDCLTIGSFISDLNTRNGACHHVPKHSLETAYHKWVTNVIVIHKTSMVTITLFGKLQVCFFNGIWGLQLANKSVHLSYEWDCPGKGTAVTRIGFSDKTKKRAPIAQGSLGYLDRYLHHAA